MKVFSLTFVKSCIKALESSEITNGGLFEINRKRLQRCNQVGSLTIKNRLPFKILKPGIFLIKPVFLRTK